MKTYLHGLFFFCIFSSSLLSAQESENKMRRNGRVTNYYKGTKSKASSGMYKKSKREGEWMFWYENGAVKAVEQYVNDTLEGAYISYLQSGDTMISCRFVHGKLEGRLVRYTAKNQPAGIYQYTHGEQEGPQYYYNQGTLLRYELIQNGQVVERIKYSSSGRISAKEYYQNKKKTGTWVEYKSSKSDTFPQKITQYQNDKLNGYMRRYRKGILIEEYYYLDNERSGPAREWTDDGVLRFEVYYKQDKKDSIARYYSNGKLMYEGNYRQNQPVGQHVSYSGEPLRLEKRYFYNDSAKLAALTVLSGNPNNDRHVKLIDRQRYEYHPDSVLVYYPNGKIRSRQIIVASVPDQASRWPNLPQTYTEYSEQGKIILTGNISGYERVGDWKGYYPNGKKRSIIHYGPNLYNIGVLEVFYPDGKKKMTCSVSGKNVDTQPQVWNAKGVELVFNSPEYDAVVREETQGHFDYESKRFSEPVEAQIGDFEVREEPPQPP
ncbi:MAG: hypothetical protein ACRCYO_15360, partial [Bacteroidia bacterium]